MRILHLPTSVGGNSYGLAKAERSIGLDARVLYRDGTWLKYPADIFLQLPPNKVGKFVKLLKTAIKVYGSYDVYHFNFGSTLLDFSRKGLNLLELPFIQKNNIVVTYNGCDARQKYRRMEQTDICACKYPECCNSICMDSKVEQNKRNRIKKFQRYGAKFCTVNPDLMRFLPEGTQFLPYTIAGWDEIRTEYNMVKYNRQKKIRIVHAPTNRVVKGSDIIIDIIKKIQRRFPEKLELVLVENIPNAEAMKIYRTADIIIDQIRVGWYGGFAVEAMKMGKPVIAYINENDLCFIPNEMAKDCMEALISADENNLEDVLRTLMDNIEILKTKNEAQLEYVYKWHDPKYVATITKKIYEE